MPSHSLLLAAAFTILLSFFLYAFVLPRSSGAVRFLPLFVIPFGLLLALAFGLLPLSP